MFPAFSLAALSKGVYWVLLLKACYHNSPISLLLLMLIQFQSSVGGKMKCFRLRPKVILRVDGVLTGCDGHRQKDVGDIYSPQESV